MLLQAAARLAALACCISPRAFFAQDAPFSPQDSVPLQAPGTAAQQGRAPSIRVTTRIVVLDAVVTDKKGNPVHAPLTQDDFTIYEDGKPQPIRSFEPPTQHQMPASTAGAALVNSAADLRKIGDAPVTLMVLDELNGRFEDMAYARQMMVKYLEAQPAVLRQPVQLLIATNTKFVQVHDYTQNRDELLDVVKKHMPEYPWRMMSTGRTGPGALERMAQVLASLQQIAQASTGTPGRKNIIWVGNGFPSINLIGLEKHEADSIETAVRRVTEQLLAARVTMYTINPTATSGVTTMDVESPDDLDLSQDAAGSDPFGAGDVAFTKLAPATGGLAFNGRNDLNNVIAQGITNGQEYYTLSYSPTSGTNDPAKFRKIRIVMKDPDLRATTREGYYPETQGVAAPVGGDKETTAKQVQRNLSLDLSQALTSTMSYNGLDVTAAKASTGDWIVSVKGSGIGWSDPDPSGAQHEEAVVGAAWYDAKGKILGHVFHEEIAPRSPDGTAPEMFPLQITLPPGVVRIRFVVRDALNGHLGTADVTKF